MNGKGPQKGDWIKCHGEQEVRSVLASLDKEGYGAVRSPGDYILITAEPKEDKLNGEKEKLSQDG